MKENLIDDIRHFAIPAGRLIDEELRTMTQCLARAADRIEELEGILRKISMDTTCPYAREICKDVLKG